MKKQIIDVKSVITIALIGALVFAIIRNTEIEKDLFLLFSNATTMILTYFFTKPNHHNDKERSEWNGGHVRY